MKDRVVSTGYNGVPEKVKNCEQGGCYRCSHRDEFESGTGYDLCICVHAEQNALLTAARHGISVEGGTLYTAMRPCFGCTKELLQADVKRVYYRWDWEHPNPDVQHQYELIQAKMTIEPLDVEDPDADWALSKRPPEPEETGHSLPD